MKRAALVAQPKRAQRDRLDGPLARADIDILADPERVLERVLAIESDAYFATRPRGAQLAAVVSRQGRVLRGREELDAGVAELEREHEGGDVARPEHWGGYRLTPESYEFWQHREDRLHDRLRYRRAGDAWLVERLSP